MAVDDIGKVVNPLIVEGQVHGGLAQGIAQALYEEAVYDDDGNLITSTLADYLVPSAADLPSFVTDRTETPGTTNPLGVKGVGEAGTIASTPAVVNAIVDALRPLGDQTTSRCRARPERVWRAIQTARVTAPGERRRGMIPAKFEYVRPATVDDAVRALADGGEDAKVIAGGQSLLPLLRLRLAYPDLLVDLGGLDELRGVRDDGDSAGHRRADHAPRRDPRPADRAALRPAGRGGGHGGRPGRAAPRHARRLAGARRPGR